MKAGSVGPPLVVVVVVWWTQKISPTMPVVPRVMQHETKQNEL